MRFLAEHLADYNLTIAFIVNKLDQVGMLLAQSEA